MSGPDLEPRPASPKVDTTASSTRAGILGIFFAVLFFNLVDKVEYVDRFLKTRRSSVTDRSATTSNGPWPCFLRGGVVISCDGAFKDWFTVVLFPTACTPLDEVAIQQPSGIIRSGLRTVLTSSSHSSRGVLIAEFCLVEK